MVISPPVAQTVVDQVVARLGANVNIMDAGGVIIASGDRSRIGTVHEGARRVLRDGATVAVSAADAVGLAGTLPGVNAPIRLEGELVGVVGLTGDPERVAAAAASVVLTVELLLAQEASQEERQWRARARTQLVEDLAAGREAGRIGEQDWQRRLHLLDADLEPPYLVLATRLGPPPTPAQERRHLAGTRPGVVLALDVEDVVWVLAGHGSHAAARADWAQTRAALARTGAHGPLVDADTAPDLPALADLVHRVRLALRGPVHGDTALRELELPVLLARLAPEAAADAAARLVAGLDPELRRTLRAFLAADLVATRAADALTVHRNTLLGRLDRITRLTGRDPRRFGDAAALHVGLLLDGDRS